MNWSEMSLHLEARASQIAAARNWVAAQALENGVAGDRIPLLKLLASELVTNAVLHGPANGPLTVRVSTSDGQLRVEVDDEGLDPPQLRDPTATEMGGRGMILLARFSTRWSWDRRASGGKTVWFDFPL
ncbi:ATP-binding protein [Cellulomonas aerilata]|nr:ATP-binding protein [Cellulomonas aerilata]